MPKLVTSTSPLTVIVSASVAAPAVISILPSSGSIEALPPGLQLVSHGDFHAGQVGIDRQRIVLFDFDEFALGDPLEDLAAFVTRLPAAGAPAEFGTLLVAAYAQAAPEQFSRRRLHWHLALQMLLQASRAFVFQVEGWRAELERRLACAEALIAPAFQESL